MHFSTALVAAFAAYTAAFPSSSHVLHEKRQTLTNDWSRHAEAPADVVISLRVALKQQNLEQIPRLLAEITNPKSKHYGKHWTGEELAQKFAPCSKSVAAVKSWLAGAGIQGKTAAHKGWIEFDATISQAEDLLKTKYHVYTRDGEDRNHVSCDDYSVPSHVSKHIDFISGTVAMNELKRSIHRRQDSNAEAPSGRQTKFTAVHDPPDHYRRLEGKSSSFAAGDFSSTGPAVASCARSVTPDCIKSMYSIPAGNTSTMGNPLGIYESMDYYDQADLDIFFTQYAPSIANGTAPMLNSIDGGLGPEANQSVSGESVLDLEVAYPIIHPQGIRLLQVDDPSYARGTKRGHFDSLLDALDASFCTFMGGDNSTMDPTYPNPVAGGYNGTKMCGTYAPPTVLSISYGYPEYYFTPNYIARQCIEFGKLGLAGTTVVASSGDSGVSASYCENPTVDVLTPNFPASCPYVTAVGATMLNTNVTDLADPQAEIAAHTGTGDDAFQSGGGFSNVFEQPSWQSNAVLSYLNQYYDKFGNNSMVKDVQYNSSGRAYPDVAAIGTNVTTITNGHVFNADGTSASTPLFASLVTLVNEERMAMGKGPVGFINPIIYGNAGQNAFKDITAGLPNSGCGMAGFSPMEGWDPITGFGVPQWEGIRNLLLSA